MLKLLKWARTPPEKKVPQSAYDALVAEYDTLVQECEALEGERDGFIQQVEDLTGKYSALGFDYALIEGLAKRALALLLEVDTTRSGGMALFRKRTDLMRDAGAAGLLEKAQGEEESDA
jgi:hypothetical protein